MENEYKVSVAILTKNPGQIFYDVFDAVLKQETPWPFEVIVIDSGSVDGTVEFVKKYPQVRLLEISSAEFGHGKTRNKAIEMANSEYVAMLTHDAKPMDSLWLANLVSVADVDSNIAGVFGRHIAYPTADALTVQELECHFSGFSGFKVVNKNDDIERYENDLGWRQFLHFFSDNNSLIRKSAWLLHPYPDVDFAEDQLWAKEIIEAGWSKGYAENAVVFHSHDYTIFERFQRSFDESYALFRLFGYRLCPTLAHLFGNCIRMTVRDTRFLLKKYGFIGGVIRGTRALFDNFARLFGHHLGYFGDKLSPRIISIISRDKRLQAGLLKKK
ncbi:MULTISPECIES: glycosyltransferase family 2 protein [Deefgea]|uniref:Glycosyltransferase n=1 Tax=Deefgea chitinilytica TaxID=570276 RepID=A0ABS2C775_9NEIS|nr:MULTISPECIES: glycosyltransferase family 2 protein [Deefgea]MBM5570017.1 glycosyltransferase [Deefgea chitinilytica]MBM9887246.1 glycosyltransferase family 2 protein [Deefgea sp. CFH1-16]